MPCSDAAPPPHCLAHLLFCSPVASISNSCLRFLFFHPFLLFFLSYPAQSSPSWLDKHANVQLANVFWTLIIIVSDATGDWWVFPGGAPNHTNRHHMHCLYIITLFWSFSCEQCKGHPLLPSLVSTAALVSPIFASYSLFTLQDAVTETDSSCMCAIFKK